MISWFNTPFNSAILIVFVIAYNIVAAVNNYDIRMVKDKKKNIFPSDTKNFPNWIRYMRWLEPLIFFIMLLMNWKCALIAWIIKAILQVLLILELIGYIILYPFHVRR